MRPFKTLEPSSAGAAANARTGQRADSMVAAETSKGEPPTGKGGEWRTAEAATVVATTSMVAAVVGTTELAAGNRERNVVRVTNTKGHGCCWRLQGTRRRGGRMRRGDEHGAKADGWEGIIVRTLTITITI